MIDINFLYTVRNYQEISWLKVRLLECFWVPKGQHRRILFTIWAWNKYLPKKMPFNQPKGCRYYYMTKKSDHHDLSKENKWKTSYIFRTWGTTGDNWKLKQSNPMWTKCHHVWRTKASDRHHRVSRVSSRYLGT